MFNKIILIPFSRGWGWCNEQSWGLCSSVWPWVWTAAPCTAGPRCGTFPSWSWRHRASRTCRTPYPAPQCCRLKEKRKKQRKMWQKDTSDTFLIQYLHRQAQTKCKSRTTVTSPPPGKKKKHTAGQEVVHRTRISAMPHKIPNICRRKSVGRAWWRAITKSQWNVEG